MSYLFTQPELIQRPHWLPMDKDTGAIIGSIRESNRDTIERINPLSYIPVYHYTPDDPIKVLHFNNVITYNEETNIITIDPFVQNIIEDIDNYVMFTRDEQSIQIVGTLDPNNWQDRSINCKYLVKEGYLCMTKWKLNPNANFTPLNRIIRKINRLENKDTKPLDINNPIDYAKIVDIYENARESVRRLYEVG